MTLSVTSSIDQITLSDTGIILIRTNNVVKDADGSIVSQSYSRDSLTPGQDLTGQPDNVVAIANISWTPEVISAYQATLIKLPKTGA